MRKLSLRRARVLATVTQLAELGFEPGLSPSKISQLSHAGQPFAWAVSGLVRALSTMARGVLAGSVCLVAGRGYEALVTGPA